MKPAIDRDGAELRVGDVIACDSVLETGVISHIAGDNLLYSTIDNEAGRVDRGQTNAAHAKACRLLHRPRDFPELAGVSAHAMRVLSLALKIDQISSELTAIDEETNQGAIGKSGEQLLQIAAEVWRNAWVYTPWNPRNRSAGAEEEREAGVDLPAGSSAI